MSATFSNRSETESQQCYLKWNTQKTQSWHRLNNAIVSNDLSRYQAATKVSSWSPPFCSLCFEVTAITHKQSSVIHVSLACATHTHCCTYHFELCSLACNKVTLNFVTVHRRNPSFCVLHFNCLHTNTHANFSSYYHKSEHLCRRWNNSLHFIKYSLVIVAHWKTITTSISNIYKILESKKKL